VRVRVGRSVEVGRRVGVDVGAGGAKSVGATPTKKAINPKATSRAKTTRPQVAKKFWAGGAG
jgi:hypothetical protein